MSSLNQLVAQMVLFVFPDSNSLVLNMDDPFVDERVRGSVYARQESCREATFGADMERVVLHPMKQELEDVDD